MEENIMAANEAMESQIQEEAAETAETSETKEPIAEESANPQKETENVTQTQAFAKRLKESNRKAVNDFIKNRLKLHNDISGTPVESLEDFERYELQNAAAGRGEDPQMAAELADARSRAESMAAELNEYKRKEQETELLSDPNFRDLYKEFKSEVDKLLEYCDSNPDKYSGIDVKTAFRSVLASKTEDVINSVKNRASTEAVKDMQRKAKASPGSLRSGTVPYPNDYAHMSAEQFNKLKADALAGRLSRS